MTFQDRTLTCQDCGSGFTFSADDQRYHEQKGYTNEPKRCPNCRQSRRNDRFSDGGYSRAQRVMYPVVCAECGKDTEVPFQPRGTRPVYCSECYTKMGGYSRRN